MYNEENNTVSVNEPMTVQVENKESMAEKVKMVMTNKNVLVGLGTIIVAGAVYYGYRFWKARKAAAPCNNQNDNKENVTK